MHLKIAALSSIVLAAPLFADVQLASPFTDHAVLQQGKSCPIFGTADAGEAVTVAFNGQTQSTTTGTDGKWRVELTDLKAGGPFALTVQGKNKIELSDILVGEVWFCSGQSNMDFTVARTPRYYFAGVNNEAEEVAAANYPTIRMFKGDTQKSYTVQTRVPGEWKVCNPENVREFSAVGYFFARDLQKELNVPVGIVCETFGGSCIEAWMRRETLSQIDDFKERLAKFDDAYKSLTDEQKKKFDAAQAAWKIEAEKAEKAGQKAPRGPANPDVSQDQHQPTVLYNGMIAPVVGYGIRGFLWYQGESVIGGKSGAKGYGDLQKALVTDWRKLWGNDDLPFYNVQLASLKNKSNNPEIRAQQATILDLPHTGMAVTIDIGDENNVHPKNKQDVGKRLCLIALANTYGKDIEYSGPQIDKVTTDGSEMRLTFTHVTGGLVAKGKEASTLTGFELAADDGKFLPAQARIEGNEVIVTAKEIASPKAVRYAWNSWAQDCNLFNKADLPAAPFKKP